MPFSFSIEQKIKGTRARAGIIRTPHGDIQTPAFIAVGTKATVKSLTPEALKDIGVQAVLANTYHLYLQPGQEIIKSAGGFAPFMNWKGPTMTDSGGFQVFSLGSAYNRNVSKVKNIDKGIGYRRSVERADGGLEGVENANNSETTSTTPYTLNPTPSRHASLAKIDENGVAFTSVIDGTAHYFTPEKSLQIQHDLAADIIVAFDECTAPDDPYEYQKEAMERTHRWAARSLAEHKKLEKGIGYRRSVERADGGLEGVENANNSETTSTTPYTLNPTPLHSEQALYGVVQGGRFEDLRKESARAIAAMDFPGFCIGGSFDKDDIYKAVEWVTDILPEGKPRHLLGMGEVIDLFEGIERGIDTFDCVSPTRLARNGALYTRDGRINMMNAEYVRDFSPIDAECRCPTCTNYTRAYVAHLFRSKEILASVLASQHNLYFIVNLVKEIRAKIIDGTFSHFKEDFLARYYVRAVS